MTTRSSIGWAATVGRRASCPTTSWTGSTRTDFLTFILAQGIAFEERVLELLRRSVRVVRIGDGWQDAQDFAKAEATFAAMAAGEPVIHQGVLRNPRDRTYGSVGPAGAFRCTRDDGARHAHACRAARERSRAWRAALALPRRGHQVHDAPPAQGRSRGERAPRVPGAGVGLQRGARAHPGLYPARLVPAWDAAGSGRTSAAPAASSGSRGSTTTTSSARPAGRSRTP